jgi:hypothetical protein
MCKICVSENKRAWKSKNPSHLLWTRLVRQSGKGFPADWSWKTHGSPLIAKLLVEKEAAFGTIDLHDWSLTWKSGTTEPTLDALELVETKNVKQHAGCIKTEMEQGESLEMERNMHHKQPMATSATTTTTTKQTTKYCGSGSWSTEKAHPYMDWTTDKYEELFHKLTKGIYQDCDFIKSFNTIQSWVAATRQAAPQYHFPASKITRYN